MNEHEEPQQIGRLAEEYARLKDEVYRVEERVERARRAYLVAALSFGEIVVQEDRLALGGSHELSNGSGASLHNLMNQGELVQLFHERSRLRGELEEVRGKLRGWLTHV
jgi:hypothetical protein